ncbi:dihydrofolate reductase family protein [Nocardia arthritidis]|uniref:Dihydrofolate reductase n=1 Tax=Nocardia arthritidis TaxID=228602 RepID=A0A6G9YHW0_9NOCA|nr:dihydrofolate reductase family protein [Nocardia arthritidis]QIS12802.1 dihydrofolate reductase [Nocardia arthritidis]
MATQYYTSTTLDGFLADSGNSLDWLFEVDDDGRAEETIAAFVQGVGAMCMGSTTYEWIAANDEPDHWAKWYGDLPCWVFTHRDLPAIPGANVRFVSGAVEPVHAEMVRAAGDKNIWLMGGGELVGLFADAGLLDEIIASIAPVTLGGGAPLLPRRIPSSRIRLETVDRMGQFAVLTYRVK